MPLNPRGTGRKAAASQASEPGDGPTATEWSTLCLEERLYENESRERESATGSGWN